MAEIILIAGAPAVGKSSTAQVLASRFLKSIHIPVDDIRDMVVSGLAYPGEEWSEPLVEQLRLARKTAAQMAMDYSQAGFVVTIDDFWDPNSRLTEYNLLEGLPGLHKILLFPGQQVAEQRNQKRSGDGIASEYISEGIRLVYEDLESNLLFLEKRGWYVLDTSDQSVEKTVDSILVWIGGKQDEI